MGRPRKQIDKIMFEKLCLIQCTQEEMCAVFACDENTLNAWCRRTYKKSFSEVFREKRGFGKVSLRRKQWQLAESSTAMAIFLGKNYLGQSDDPVAERRTESENILKALDLKAAEVWKDET